MVEFPSVADASPLSHMYEGSSLEKKKRLKDPPTQVSSDVLQSLLHSAFKEPVKSSKDLKIFTPKGISKSRPSEIQDADIVAEHLKTAFEAAQEHLKEEDNKKWDRTHDNKQNNSVGSVKVSFAEEADASIDVGISTGKGRRPYIEDEYTAMTIGEEIPYFAIYDGHKGSNCASYIAKKFPEHLGSQLKDSDNDVSWFNTLRLTPVTLSETYRQDGEAFKEMSGSTAIGCLINNDQLWVFNVGDSRAMLSMNGTPVVLSKDAKPEAGQKDVEVIEKIARLKGIYSFTHAIGHDPDKTGIRSDATVIKYSLERLADANNYLIIGSDGFWDVVSCNQAAKAVNELAISGKNPQEIALSLAKRALMVSDDNVTVMVVNLARWKPEEITCF